MRYQDECVPLVSSVDTVYYDDLRVAQVNNRNDFPLVFCIEKLFPAFWYTRPCRKSDKKRVCNRASVCVLLLVPILLARVRNYVDVPELV